MLLLFETNVFSQETKLLLGQILTDSVPAENVHVVNLNLMKGTTSNQSGAFTIEVKMADTLFFSSVQFENKEVVVDELNFQSGNIIVKLSAARNELPEISLSDLRLSGHLDTDLPRINYFKREKFGIPYPEKRLSQTERRLYTANANITSRWQYIGVLLGGVPIDVIMNDINGRTKYLKNLAKREKLQVDVQRGIDLLGKSFFITTLNLPESEIENFVFYCTMYPEFFEYIESSKILELIEFYESKTEGFINLRQINDPKTD
ncbi:carboxypeptidase-like regulatory domain-containing protein [Gramella lutea]|uniref:Carboxypeptidase-like regulatory domain-containing protein n=1 Tax=Christiangramia lutea TaxID=1607951 RepID=A0A9X1V428_9FLAO|nr:carboxypeptidase-like regulatory domain-containing protein [Christiangramia lutea]MCH4824072.1 carboxypeptidase-like regulatory domain-containing protein [Christiangramia lutea]